MKNSIKMGVIGLGARGTMILKDVLLPMEDVEVIAVCDVYEDRINDAIAMTKEHNHNLPLGFADYRELLKIQDLEAVYIATSWQTHFEIPAAALEAGVPVACDVGGAFSLNEIWKLVRTYENTKTPCMFMENCCYGRDEMMLMNMRKKGVFGEIVHLSLIHISFITVWNDFIWPLVVVSTDDMTTLTLGLSTLQGLYLTNYGLVMAGATLTFIVPFTLYIFLQKQFVEGIALSGIKG